MNLVEREPELAKLRSLFAESLDGRGRVVVVGGPVAAGKTALLRAFAEHAGRSGAAFIAATAARAERQNPLGLARQIFHGLESLPGARDDVKSLLDEGMGTAAFTEEDFRSEAPVQMTGPILHELCGSLLDLSARTPLVIGIDDVHHADPASLQFLLYVSHRLTSARILMILTERVGPWREHPLFHADLLSQPHSRHLRLNLLSRRAQARLLAPDDPRTGHWLASVCHAITGGNPLLVHAVLKDNRAAGPDGAGDLTVDAAFPQAVLSCLHRGGPAMSGIARALAVLREPVSPALLGRLVDLGTEHAANVIDAMNMAGLLDSGRFRHTAARTVVLDSMAPEERAALHGRAALLLHEHGAAPTVVAGHLALAGAGSAGAWAVPVLEEAAARALADGESRAALSYLRLARGACPDEARRARIAGALARAEWRIDPAAVERLLPELVTAAREGLLDERHATTLLHCLMWCGRPTEAGEVLRRLAALTSRSWGPSRGLGATRLLVRSVYPGLAAHAAAADPNAERDEASVSAAAARHLRASAALAAVLTGDPVQNAASTAGQVLQGTRLGETPAGSVIAALAALVYDDRPGKAAHWCDPLLEEAETASDPVTRAVLAAARAVISVRQGDLAEAERHARAALSRIPPGSWGVAIGVPISVMVLAATALGRYEDAATYLGVAVPGAMYQTPCGLHYLQARGHYYLATGQPSAALADFRACGDLMRGWGFDTPGLVPWRTDTARALIDLGETEEAAVLVDEQLAMLRPGVSRTRGVSLRVRAACAVPARRRALLQEAVNVLEQAGDQYELALALADLSQSGAPGPPPPSAAPPPRPSGPSAEPPPGRARPPAEPPAGAPAPAAPAETPAGAPAPGDPDDPSSGTPAGLTDAERRVAALAADGHTNRQIAGTLLITVSTVEQHLTRVYRKLRVNRRADLRPRLRASPTDACAVRDG